MTRSCLTRSLAVCAPFVLSACATIGPPQPPSLNLPNPPSDLRASRKGNEVRLTWTVPATTTDRQTIRELGPTWICREVGDLKQCGTPVGQTPAQVIPSSKTAQKKLAASYVDVVPANLENDSRDAFATYAVEVLNESGRGAGISNAVRIPLAHTLPPPKDFHAEVTNQGVGLHWSADSVPVEKPPVRYVYRVFRSAAGTSDRTLVGQIPAGDRQSFSLDDTNIEWEKTYIYRAETVTFIEAENKPAVQVEGDDTPELKIFADDRFPPAVPTELQAVFSGPGQKPFIDLLWGPVSDADLAGYNIYRREDGGVPARINSELIQTPAYRDTSVEAGKHYLYSTSSVDLRGNESARSEEASESVP